MRNAGSVGWSHRRFGRLEGDDPENPALAAFCEVVPSPGIAPSDHRRGLSGPLQLGYGARRLAVPAAT